MAHNLWAAWAVPPARLKQLVSWLFLLLVYVVACGRPPLQVSGCNTVIPSMSVCSETESNLSSH